jgi:hypothetical protein
MRSRRFARLRRLARALGCSLLCFSCGIAHGQTVRRDFWVANAEVAALAVSGNTLYMGGAFTRVGPVTGSGVPVEAASGKPVATFPIIAGSVSAAAPDGAGGWFVCGEFTSVGGIPRMKLAHIRADNTVAPWNPSPNGGVRALVVIGNQVYVGGSFTLIAGQSRRFAASLDGTTGAATAWDPGPDGPVRAFAVSNGTIFVAGAFENIGGLMRRDLAAVDAESGLALDWHPSIRFDSPYASIYSLALGGRTLYLAGDFSAVGGMPRNRAAGLDITTGRVTPWDPDLSPWWAGIYTMAASGSKVYVFGTFSEIGGRSRRCLAALDGSTGRASDWDPHVNGFVGSLAVSGGTVYAGGSFTTIGGQPRNNVAALDAETGLATAWDPDVAPVNAPVSALAPGGDRVFVGGEFTSIGGTKRNRLAALDLRTGRLTDWDPGADGVVNTLAATGGTVYAGGSFSTAGGVPRRGIAALDAASGRATPWNANADDAVRALAVRGRNVYAGGDFRHIGGQPRAYIAALDAASGLATNWAPEADNRVQSLALGNGVVYAGGVFHAVGGQPRGRIAALDAGTGLATDWCPDANNWVSGLAASRRGVFAIGAFDHIGGRGRNFMTGLDARTGLATWDPEPPRWCPDADWGCREVGVGAIASVGGMVIVGGQSREDEYYLVGLDAATGHPTGWSVRPDGMVGSIAADEREVFAGGSFRTIGGAPQTCLAAIAFRDAIPAGPVKPASRVGAPEGATVLLRPRPDPSHGVLAAEITLPDEVPARLELMDLAGRRLCSRDVGTLGAGRHVVDLAADRSLPPGVYLLRLTRAGSSITARAVVIR